MELRWLFILPIFCWPTVDVEVNTYPHGRQLIYRSPKDGEIIGWDGADEDMLPEYSCPSIDNIGYHKTKYGYANIRNLWYTATDHDPEAKDRDRIDFLKNAGVKAKRPRMQ